LQEVKPENKEKLGLVLKMYASPDTFKEKALRKEANKGRKMFRTDGSYLTVVVDDSYVGGAKVFGCAPARNGVVLVVDARVDLSK